MAEHLLPAVVAVFLWWFATGAILYLDGMRRETFRTSLGAATALLALAVYGLIATRDMTDAYGAVLAFLCGLTIWGWLELAFLTGFVTGPERRPCPPGLAGWPRFARATRTLLHHELAILAAAAWTASLTLGGDNRIALWTVLVLWGMRLSAKLNLFLGVRNLNAEFLPDHLRYLGTYFGSARSNPLLPVSLIGSILRRGPAADGGLRAGRRHARRGRLHPPRHARCARRARTRPDGAAASRDRPVGLGLPLPRGDRTFGA
jgi:putative photosynthetic complex assembly protein 2